MSNVLHFPCIIFTLNPFHFHLLNVFIQNSRYTYDQSLFVFLIVLMKLKRILDLFTHKNINNCYNKLFIVDT